MQATIRLVSATCPVLLAAALASPPARAQNFIAWPQDATTGGSANNAALGRNATGSTDEAHVQIAIPAAFLPSAGGIVTGIAVAANASVTVPYASLQIRAANLPRTMPFPALNPTFATNLGPAPVTVLQQSPFSIAFAQRQWVQIAFTTPFAYNGGDHLVLDFQKVVANTAAGGIGHLTASDRAPYDLPIMMVAVGGLGSGAALAAANTSTGTRHAPRLRVLFLNSPTTVVGNQSNWALGTPVSLTTQASTASIGLQLIELTGTPLNARTLTLPFPGIAGFGWVNPAGNLASLFFGPSSGTAVTTTIPTPAIPALRGTVVLFQSLVVDPVAGVGWTNAVDATLQ